MKVLRAVSEDVVWSEFLRAERDKLPLPGLVQESARLTSAPRFRKDDNARRKELLRQIQGGFLNTIPENTKWSEVRLGSPDAPNLFAPRFPVWIAASDGSCSLSAIAANLANKDWSASESVTANLNMNSLVLEMEFASLRGDLARLAKSTDEFHPIGVSAVGSEKVTVIHGVKQMAARLAKKGGAEFEVDGFLGKSEWMSSCPWLVV